MTFFRLLRVARIPSWGAALALFGGPVWASPATIAPASPSVSPLLAHSSAHDPIATFETTEGRAGTSRVHVRGQVVLTFDEDKGTVARFACDHLNAAYRAGQLRADQVRPGKRGDRYVVTAGNDDLLVFDRRFARRQAAEPAELAERYVNQLRSALGAPAIHAAHSRGAEAPFRAASRGGFEPRGALVGLASWYGGFFHGRRAADGSRFDQNGFTAAHKSLPFGTILKVTNLQTQQSTFVRVTDRGPYIPGRMLDLSRAAARAIGLVHQGVGRVKVTIFRPKS